jgi:hypothetical protein
MSLRQRPTFSPDVESAVALRMSATRTRVCLIPSAVSRRRDHDRSGGGCSPTGDGDDTAFWSSVFRLRESLCRV